jgi:hypothetical protein
MEDICKYLWGTTASNGDVDRVAFWTCVTAIATITLFFVAWYQLVGLKKVSKADFINKFTDGFFNENTQKIILLLTYNALEFKIKDIIYGNDDGVEEFAYFKINEKIVKQLPIDKVIEKKLLEKEIYTSFEIDDLLLGYFEDIGCFEKDNLIGIKGVYDTFDAYLQTTWENPVITEYIKYTGALNNDSNDIYEHLKYIYEKDKSYCEAKINGKSIWLWDLRWKFSNFILKRSHN